MRHYSESDLCQIRRIDPTPILMRKGYTFKRTGRSYVIYSGEHKLVRLSHKLDDTWVWIGHGNESASGDNISLLKYLLKVSFYEAIELLLSDGHGLLSNASGVCNPQHSIDKAQDYLTPRVPTVPAEQVAITRQYLNSVRGISLETIAYAEQSGFIRYGYNGVIFCGYDEHHKLRNAEFRASLPSVTVQKMVLKGSNKKYPAILQGITNKVWIVEGGMDALALRDIALRQGETPPTIIMSGGAGVSGFIHVSHIQSLLQKATKITIALDHEKNQTIQEQTNAMHHKQFLELSKVVNKNECEICFYMPPYDKDLADLNLRLKMQSSKRG